MNLSQLLICRGCIAVWKASQHAVAKINKMKQQQYHANESDTLMCVSILSPDVNVHGQGVAHMLTKRCGFPTKVLCTCWLWCAIADVLLILQCSHTLREAKTVASLLAMRETSALYWADPSEFSPNNVNRLLPSSVVKLRLSIVSSSTLTYTAEHVPYRTRTNMTA